MLFPGQESSILEFKREFPQNHQVVKTTIAFCNAFGGRLVIGVEDDGIIIGVPEEHVQAIITFLQTSIYQSCTPTIIPSIYTQRIADKIVVIVEVSEGMNKPYFMKSDGLQKGTYIRQGSHTNHADDLMIQELQWHSLGLSLDATPIDRASMDELDSKKIHAFLQQQSATEDSPDLNSTLRQYRLITEQHQNLIPTVAGILLFGKAPRQFLADAFMMATHYKGTYGGDVITTINCEGSLVDQFSQALDFISRSVKGKNEIPEEALREIIINALVHRHYQLPDPIKIAIYEDRVEVLSPGNFPGPLQPDQLEMGYSYLRNPVIYRALREYGLIATLGSGFLTVFSRYRENKLPLPTIIESDNFVKAILPRS